MNKLDELKYNWSENNITRFEANLLIELLIKENDHLYKLLEGQQE